jgi:hypothetical protein
MFRKCYICLLITLSTIFGINLKAETYDEVVSLGYGCQVAHQLEAHGMRKLAYPFDWFHTPFKGLLSFITYKGKNFWDINKIHIVGVYPGDPNNLEVHDLNYGIISYHDFSSSPALLNYAAVKGKYDRRTKRFFDLLNSTKKVLFVCQYYTKVQIEQLDELLRSSYPSLSFTLIAVGNTEDFKIDWHLPRIENYFMEEVFGDWRGNFPRWTEILSQYSVKHNEHLRSIEDRW